MDIEAESIPDLEAAVDKQCKDGTHDIDESLMLLKLYQFFPEKSNADVIARVLLKALMQLPETDFLLCTYLIPERTTSEPPVLTVCELAEQLESCLFQDFWASLEEADRRELVDSVPGFRNAIRGYVLSVVSLTYQTVDATYLAQILNVDDSNGEEMGKLVATIGWREGETVHVTLSNDNQAMVQEAEDAQAIRVDQLSKAIRSMAHAFS